MAELRKNEKLKNSITEFVAALKDFAAWAYEENAPVEELNDKDDIRKAFKERRSNFAVPILQWEILHMSWLNKTGFWYDGFYITPYHTEDVLLSGFIIDGIGTYKFYDFFDEDNLCLGWEKLVECMVEDIAVWHRYSETNPF